MKHDGPVHAIAFHPNGKVVATASRDKIARLWEVPSGKPMGEPMTHPDTPTQIAFSPDGTLLASICGERAYLWDPASGKPIGKKLAHDRGRLGRLAFSPDSKLLCTGGVQVGGYLWRVP
jgi:WD40 repeat protein